MLQPSAHAIIQRLLFTKPTGVHCFWGYTHIDDEISLIIDEASVSHAAGRLQHQSRPLPLRLPPH